ncbi:MAG: hypothetical protein JXA97_01915 [Anaerolineales bacterium]|nr:hypothetical protein [Anaerolineales bacterium]
MGNYSIQQDDHLQLVRVHVQGKLDEELGHEIITKARGHAAESGFSILYDVREADHQVSIADWFFLPRKLDVLQKHPIRSVKAAVVISQHASREYDFYQNVADNVGLTFRVFMDEEEAITWLTGSIPA